MVLPYGSTATISSSCIHNPKSLGLRMWISHAPTMDIRIGPARHGAAPRGNLRKPRMPRTSANMIREMFRILAGREGLSNRQLAGMAGLSPSTVCLYRKAMIDARLDPASLAAMDDEGIESLFGPVARRDETLAEPDWKAVLGWLRQPLPHRKARRTIQGAWLHAYVIPMIKDPAAAAVARASGRVRACDMPPGVMSAATFRRRAREALARLSPRLDSGLYDGESVLYAPGEQALIDASGDPLLWEDRAGERHEARVLVGVLPYSGLLYISCAENLTTPSWCSFVIRMVRYFGGVPGSVISDNDPAIVNHGRMRGARPEPKRPNDAYRSLCAALGTVPVLTGTRAPRSKAAAERAVRQAQQSLFENDRVEVRAGDALRALEGRARADGIAALQDMLREESDRLNTMPYSGREHSRRSWFESYERQSLAPLPDPMPDYLAQRPRTVHDTGYVMFRDNLYFLGGAHAGEMVYPRLAGDLSMVEFLTQGGRTIDTYKIDTNHYPTPRRHMGKRYKSQRERRASMTRGEIEAAANGLGAAREAFLAYVAMDYTRERYPESAARRDCNSLLSLLGKLSGPQLAAAAAYLQSFVDAGSKADFNTMRSDLCRFLRRLGDATGGGAGQQPCATGQGDSGEPSDPGMSYPEGFFEAKLAAMSGDSKEGR